MHEQRRLRERPAPSADVPRPSPPPRLRFLQATSTHRFEEEVLGGGSGGQDRPRQTGLFV